jgi:hypothetical protein
MNEPLFWFFRQFPTALIPKSRAHLFEFDLKYYHSAGLHRLLDRSRGDALSLYSTDTV